MMVARPPLHAHIYRREKGAGVRPTSFLKLPNIDPRQTILTLRPLPTSLKKSGFAHALYPDVPTPSCRFYMYICTAIICDRI